MTVDAHSHSDEALGAPPEPKDLEEQIEKVDNLLSRVKIERAATKPAFLGEVLNSFGRCRLIACIMPIRQGRNIHAIPRPMSHPRIPRSGNKMMKKTTIMPHP
jgi:hypothetical protein